MPLRPVYISYIQAAEILKANLNNPKHHFWKDEISLADAITPFADRFKGHQQTADEYLFGLAIYKRGLLATFDTGIAGLVQEGSIHLKSLEFLPF